MIWKGILLGNPTNSVIRGWRSKSQQLYVNVQFTIFYLIKKGEKIHFCRYLIILNSSMIDFPLKLGSI